MTDKKSSQPTYTPSQAPTGSPMDKFTKAMQHIVQVPKSAIKKK
jgi:hypothetical protein